MQASKIIPNKTYAVKRGEGLERFRVSYVQTVTTRKNPKPTPHDHESTVFGHWVENPSGLQELSPDAILGEFEQYVELVERKKQEDDAKEAKSKADKAQALKDRLTLYAFIGVTPPQKADDYGNLFRVNWGKVDVTSEGAAKLAARVREGFPSLAGGQQ